MAFENFESFKSYRVGGEGRRRVVKGHTVYIRFGIPSTHILVLKSSGIIAKNVYQHNCYEQMFIGKLKITRDPLKAIIIIFLTNKSKEFT